MKDQTIKQYANMVDYCETTLREHWGMGADPAKLIGLAEEIGMQDLADEFRQQLKEEKEVEQTKSDYLTPTELKTFGGR
jgi:ferritin-like metal-binding protein YciE